MNKLQRFGIPGLMDAGRYDMGTQVNLQDLEAPDHYLELWGVSKMRDLPHRQYSHGTRDSHVIYRPANHCIFSSRTYPRTLHVSLQITTPIFIRKDELCVNVHNIDFINEHDEVD
jgi:hypothetical protein